jgi:endoglucanase
MMTDMAAEGHAVAYVSDRIREKNEINGKSNNLNNALKNYIYKDIQDYTEIPSSECLVVFDADMCANNNFFIKILEVMYDERVSLCLTPQGFHNINLASDIFNNSNLSFWEYILPGCDAVGYIACTGTNFCIRANALCECGWFPTYTITEDYALGMELKKRDKKAVYLNEYIALGEAPEEIRNIFRQRSRWCKGQMQVCVPLQSVNHAIWCC